MISQSAEYALRVTVCLAANPGVPMTTVQLAEATDVPQFYLAKLMRTLVEAGLASSRRGINGGFQLARDPASLTLLEVIQTVTTRAGARHLNGAAEKKSGLYIRLMECRDFVQKTLSTSTIADMVSAGEDRSPEDALWQLVGMEFASPL